MALNVLNRIIPNIVELIGSSNKGSIINGSVVSFYYQNFNHDPYPVIISTGPMSNNRIGGLNLHYLTFPVFRALLNSWAGNAAFNYFIIKNEPVIKNAFRSYNISGIKNIKKIHYKAILEIMSIKRNFSPEEMSAIQQAVDKYVMSRQPEILNELFGSIMIAKTQEINQQPMQTIKSTQTAPIQQDI